MLRQNVTTCYDEEYNNIFFALLIVFKLSSIYIRIASKETEAIKFYKLVFFSIKKMLRQVTILA